MVKELTVEAGGEIVVGAGVYLTVGTPAPSKQMLKALAADDLKAVRRKTSHFATKWMASRYTRPA